MRGHRHCYFSIRDRGTGCLGMRMVRSTVPPSALQTANPLCIMTEQCLKPWHGTLPQVLCGVQL